MTTARNNRRRKAKATKRLARWRACRPWREWRVFSLPEHDDQYDTFFTAQLERIYDEACIPRDIFGGLAGQGLSWPKETA